MPNRWVSFVKEFAAKNKISYGCALGKPELKSQYYAKYPKKGSEKKMPEPEPEVIEIIPVKKKRVKKAKAKPMLEELPDLEDITDLEDLPSLKKKGGMIVTDAVRQQIEDYLDEYTGTLKSMSFTLKQIQRAKKIVLTEIIPKLPEGTDLNDWYNVVTPLFVRAKAEF